MKNVLEMYSANGVTFRVSLSAFVGPNQRRSEFSRCCKIAAEGGESDWQFGKNILLVTI